MLVILDSDSRGSDSSDGHPVLDYMRHLSSELVEVR